ncbi:MAG: PQQ-dependent sugar dehydrogenase [Mycobacteriales bacterium]
MALLRRCVVLLASSALVSLPSQAWAADPRAVQVSLVSAASSRFVAPTVVTNAGDARLFVAEQRGLIRVVSGGRVQATPYLDLRRSVGRSTGEQGLLGLAFHPDFARNRFFYVAYNNADGSLQLTRFQAVTAGAATASFASRVPLLTVPHPNARHNGGMIAFGPDGMLYLSVGDGYSTPQKAQDLSSLLGKILRIDVNRSCAPTRYCIPAGNPFASTPGARREIWHLGLRNPWRFSFDRVAGSLWIGDVGNAKYEEVDTVAKGLAGRNFGWPCREGAHSYSGSCRAGALTYPVVEMAHDTGMCALIGGYVYRGRQSPALAGTYVFADLCSGKIYGVSQSGGRWVRAQIGKSLDSLSSFGESASGELYAVDLVGRLTRLVGAPV